MIRAIAQIQPRAFADQAVLLTQQRCSNLPLRPERAAQEDQLATGFVDAVDERPLLWVADDLQLQLFELLCVTLQYRKSLVDDQVDQRIEEVIHPTGAYPPTRAGLQAPRHRRKIGRASCRE